MTVIGLAFAVVACSVDTPSSANVGATSGECSPGESCICDGTGSCSQTCTGRGCTLVCRGAGSCDLACPEGGCTVQCQATGSCNVSQCSDDSCVCRQTGTGSCGTN